MYKNLNSVHTSEKEVENIVNSLAKKTEKDYNCRDFIIEFCYNNEMNRNLPFAVNLFSRNIADLHKQSTINNNIKRSDTHWIIRKRYAICFFIWEYRF